MSDYRRTIDAYLSEISHAVGKSIRLNDQGICAFTYESFMIVIEVPESVGSFFIYCSLVSAGQFQDAMATYKMALELNYLQQETRGGCLSIDPVSSDLMFSYTDRIGEINATDLRNILENFIDTLLKMDIKMKEVTSHGQSSGMSSGLPPELMGHMHHHLMP